MKLCGRIALTLLFWTAATTAAHAKVIECVVEQVMDATYVCRDKLGSVFNLARDVGDYTVGDTIRRKTGTKVRYDDYEVLAVKAPELVLRDRTGNLITLKKHLKGFREGDLVRYVLPGSNLPADYQIVRNVAPFVKLRDEKGKEIQVERDPGGLRPGDRVEYDRKRKKIRKDKNGKGN